MGPCPNVLYGFWLGRECNDACQRFSPHQGHDIAVSARVPPTICFLVAAGFLKATRVAAANTGGCGNKFCEVLITTNPLKPGHRCGVAYLRNANRGCSGRGHVSDPHTASS